MADNGNSNAPTYNSSYVPTNNNAESNSFRFQTQLTGDIAINYQENMLDKFDLPTYHFKFFMVGPTSQTNGTYLNPDNQVIIAESGISDSTIDDVEIDATCQQSYESGTGTSNIFNFRITEPAGASLLDKMFYSALELGIGNWVKSPFYLELSFRARNPENSTVDNGLSKLKWIWPLQISNMKANITKVGTIYDFSATIYNEFAFNNTTASVQQNIVLENVRTVGDAINQLQNKLNRDAAKQLILGYLVPDVYEITLEDSLKNLSVIPANNAQNSSRANSYNTLDTKTFTFPAGTGIDNMINTILATTDYFQTKIKNSKDPDSLEEVSDSALQQLWRIVPYTVPYKYDTGRQSNAHYIHYFVVKFDKGNLPPTATNSSTEKYGKDRYDTYKKAGILRKKYDYIFTGLNDQVYEFNLEFNNGWAAPTSRFSGLYYNSSHVDTGLIHNQQSLDKRAAALEAAAKYAALFNDSRATERDKLAAQSEYTQKINDAALSDQEVEGIQRYLDQAKDPAGSLRSVRNIVARSPDQAGINSVNGQVPRFVSDQQMLSSDRIQQLADDIIASGQAIRPISSVSAATEKELSDGVEDKASPGRNYTSALFAQAMSQTAGGDYGNIRIKVKGDPYWLQPEPVSTNESSIPAPTITSIKTKLESTANFNVSTNFMLVRLRTPKLFSDIGSNVSEPLTEVDTISALYSVNKVKSSFSKGIFSQELEGTIDPPVEISKFIKEIEAEEKALAAQANAVAENRDANPIPEIAIRSDIATSQAGVGTVLVNNFGEIQTPGFTQGKTLSELSASSLVNSSSTGSSSNETSIPGLNTNEINSIGAKSSIPGLSSDVNLNKFKRTR